MFGAVCRMKRYVEVCPIKMAHANQAAGNRPYLKIAMAAERYSGHHRPALCNLADCLTNFHHYRPAFERVTNNGNAKSSPRQEHTRGRLNRKANQWIIIIDKGGGVWTKGTKWRSGLRGQEGETVQLQGSEFHNHPQNFNCGAEDLLPRQRIPNLRRAEAQSMWTRYQHFPRHVLLLRYNRLDEVIGHTLDRRLQRAESAPQWRCVYSSVIRWRAAFEAGALQRIFGGCKPIGIQQLGAQQRFLAHAHCSCVGV